MEKLSIGKMAELNHVSVQTLRHYDKIGLLKPVLINDENNYRYYNIKQSAKLDMIQYMKSLGMSLEQIKEQFDKEDIEAIQRLLKKQKKLIDRKIKELQQMRNAVDICMENYYRYLRIPKEGYIEIQHIPQRKIFCYDGGLNIYEYNLETYEYILRKLKEQVILQKLPTIYFCNVGSILRKKMLDECKLVSTEIFLFVDDDFQDGEGIELIPENDFVCIYCNSFWKEKEYAQKLFQYIRDRKYIIVGDYICEVVVELPIFDQDERNMFIKLQIPVKTS